MSEIKVNKITPRTGTTITLGDSGDSLSIASGVALTDFTSTGIDDNATSTALTIDSSGNIGIGTSSINSKLDVRGTGAITLNVGSTDGTSARLTLDATNGDASGGDFPLLLSDGSDLLIEANNSTSDAEIRFRNNGSDAMRIDSSGNVLVGQSTVSTSSPGTIITQSGKSYHIATSDIALALDRKTTDGEILQIRKDQTVLGGIGSNDGDVYISSSTSGHKGLRFGNGAIVPTNTSGGTDDNATTLGGATQRFANLYLGGSVYLGGTGSANALDDYEEGSFTPTYSTEGGGESITYDGITSGSYIKVGQLVLITGNIRTNGWSGGSSYVYLGGFPFTVNSDENAKSYIGFARANNFTGESPLNGECVNGGTKAFLKYRTSVSGDHQNTDVSDMNTGTTKNVIYFTGVYRTS